MAKLFDLKLWAGASGFFLLFSCASFSTDQEFFSNAENSNCSVQPAYHYTISDMPDSLAARQSDPVTAQYFSFESRNIANAFGFLPLLSEFAHLTHQKENTLTTEDRLNLLEMRQRIFERINISSLEVSAVASELDCEEKRTNQLSGFLRNQADQRERNLVISTIIVGATGAITAEVLSNTPSAGKSGSFVAIGTSLIEATLGILLLTNKKSMKLSHPRNTLGDIWNAPPISTTLPKAVWYYLNFKDAEKRGESLREILTRNWTVFGQIEKKPEAKRQISTDIYFGAGAQYSYEDLKNRANMYDQLEAYVSLMKQDLKTLSREFEKVK